MKRGPGRPKLSKKQSKGKFLVVRLLPDERKAVVNAAAKAEQKLSVWVRSALLDKANNANVTSTEAVGLEPQTASTV